MAGTRAARKVFIALRHRQARTRILLLYCGPASLSRPPTRRLGVPPPLAARPSRQHRLTFLCPLRVYSCVRVCTACGVRRPRRSRVRVRTCVCRRCGGAGRRGSNSASLSALSGPPRASLSAAAAPVARYKPERSHIFRYARPRLGRAATGPVEKRAGKFRVPPIKNKVKNNNKIPPNTAETG